jgi:predicted metal-dependent phosphoesterase TrpH
VEQHLGKADLHLHTTYSDGAATPRELVEAAARAGLGLIAVTDHDTVEGAREARRIGAAYGVEVIVGEEVSTRDGHLLVLFAEEHLPPGRSLAATAAAARAQGALVVAPHPFALLVKSLGRTRYARCCADPSWRAHVDAVEAFNAGLWLPHHNHLAARFAAEHGLPAVGGSDSHHLATLASGYTLFPGRSAADLRRAIVAGQTRAGGLPWGALRSIESGALVCLGLAAGRLKPGAR